MFKTTGQPPMTEPVKKDSNSLLSDIYEAFVGNESALKRYLGRFVYRAEDIDDMAQETFLRAYKATEMRKIDYPKAYLFRVAKSVALRQLSKKAQQVTDYLEEARVDETLNQATLEEELQADQKVQLYCAAIAELPPQCRRVFIMRKYQALSHKEIAKQLNVTVGAVEKQVTLGIKRCMAYVEKMENSGESSVRKEPGNAPSGKGGRHE